MLWSSIPIELTFRILSFFDPTELVNLRGVNSSFKSLIDETVSLQYRIALFASGMVDGPPGGLTTSERLELLRNYEDSWRNLEWSDENPTIVYPGRLAWEFCENVWAHYRGTDVIHFVQLPSRLRGIAMRHWTLRFDFAVLAFSMDPSQDLLVIIEDTSRNLPDLCRIQLRTLSTGEKHPLAESPVTMNNTLSQRNIAFYSVRICGDYVGILGREGRDVERNELVVWSWKTGVQNLVDLSTTVQSFVFLDDNFILVSSWEPPALLVYSLAPRHADDTTPTNTHFLRFLFGTRFQEPQGRIVLYLASNPSSGWLPNARQVPFHISGDEQMIAIHSQFFDDRGRQMFLIPTKALLRQIESLLPEEGLDVEWEVYGPQLTEHVLEQYQGWGHAWPYIVFGMRHVLPEVLYLDGKPNILICDFSPRRYLRASKEERDESDALYEVVTSQARCTGMRNPCSILKCVPLPESIVSLSDMRFWISEDGIVILENEGAVGDPVVLRMLSL